MRLLTSTFLILTVLFSDAAWSISAAEVAQKQKTVAIQEIQEERASLMSLANKLDKLEVELIKIKIDSEQTSLAEAGLFSARVASVVLAVGTSLLTHRLFKRALSSKGHHRLSEWIGASIAFMNTTTLLSYTHEVSDGHMSISQIEMALAELAKNLETLKSKTSHPKEILFLDRLMTSLDQTGVLLKNKCKESCSVSFLVGNSIFALLGVSSWASYMKTHRPSYAVAALVANILGSATLNATFSSTEDVTAIIKALNRAQAAVYESLDQLDLKR